MKKYYADKALLEIIAIKVDPSRGTVEKKDPKWIKKSQIHERKINEFKMLADRRVPVVLLLLSLLQIWFSFTVISLLSDDTVAKERFKSLSFPTSSPTSERVSSANVQHDIVKTNRSLANKEQTIMKTNLRELPGNKVFLTGPLVPDKIIKKNLQINANLEFHFFNNSAMARSVRLIDQQLVADANVTGAWKAWKSLRAWAFRADLWRYMILWSEGGMYLDTKVQLTAPIETWAALMPEKEDLAACYDNNKQWDSSLLGPHVPLVWNGILSARKESPVLLDAIQMVIHNVHNRSYYLLKEEEPLKSYKHADLSITGPVLFGYATYSYQTNGQVRIPCTFRRRYECSMFYQENPQIPGQQIARMKTTEHNRVNSHGNAYGALWNDRVVYCDGPKQPTREQDVKPCDMQALLPELYPSSGTI